MNEEHAPFFDNQLVRFQFFNRIFEFLRGGDDTRKCLGVFRVVGILLAEIKSSIQSTLVFWQEDIDQEAIYVY